MGQEMRKALSAYTLVELAIVVVILGILAATTIPRIADAIKSQESRAIADKVAIDLAFARDYAKATNVQVKVKFDAPNNRYTLEGVPDDAKGTPDTVVDLKKMGMPIDDFVLSNGTDTLSFDRFGQAVGDCVVDVTKGSETIKVEVQRTDSLIKVLK